MLNRKNITNIGRGKELVAILIRYGFQNLLDKLTVDTGLVSKNITKIESGLSLPIKIRKVLEEMGATFIKLGQLASMRPDLLPAEYIEELEKLQDDVPTLKSELIINTIEKELGQKITDIFLHFDHTPIASGSISQVHKGVLAPNAKMVAIKVQRANIEKVIAKDLDLIEWFAIAIDSKFSHVKSLNLPGLAKELRRTITKELDFKQEAVNIEAFRKLTTDSKLVTAPVVYHDYTTKRVLIMELIDGTKPSQYIGPPAWREKLASAVLLTYIDSAFDRGFFHADPHAGNVLISEDKICFLDWGMTGRLSSNMQLILLQVILAIMQCNAERLIKVSLKAFGQRPGKNHDLLIGDVEDLLILFQYQRTSDRSIGKLLLAYINILRHYQIRIPTQYVLMCRALLSVEGLAKILYPNIDILAVIKPSVKNKLFRYVNPLTAGNKLVEQTTDLLWWWQEMPEKLNRLLDLTASGEFKLVHKGLFPLRSTIMKAADKLALALVTGALVVGSSLVITTNTPPLVFGHSAIGLIGYLFSSILGVLLVLNILRGK